jgi:uncharacterized protein YneF (UPF0154 family)
MKIHSITLFLLIGFFLARTSLQNWISQIIPLNYQAIIGFSLIAFFGYKHLKIEGLLK